MLLNNSWEGRNFDSGYLRSLKHLRAAFNTGYVSIFCVFKWNEYSANKDLEWGFPDVFQMFPCLYEDTQKTYEDFRSLQHK